MKGKYRVYKKNGWNLIFNKCTYESGLLNKWLESLSLSYDYC